MSTDYPNIRPSLLLDFANTKKLDPRITFSRTTTATYYDGVTTAKAEQNLLTYSQEFDNAAWSKTASTVTANSTTAPDGTSTADTLTETATTNYHSTYQTNISLAATSYTFSCFAKPNGRNEITLVMLSGSDTAYATYNVSTGSITVAATTSGSFSSASTTITASANGFYRVTLTATAPSTSTATIAIELYNAARSYAGNGTSGVYLWGAQLEQRSSATAYTATTTQAITNYIPVLQTAAAGQARFDHNPTTGESLGLLIEEARTNLCLRSAEFDNASWSKTSATVTANQSVAPDGTISGDQIVFSGAGSYENLTQSVSVSSSVAYTFTVWLRGTAGQTVSIVLFDGPTVDVTTVTLTAAFARYSVTHTIHSSVSSVQCVIQSRPGDTAKWFYAWGAQLEAGSFATSYIPTVASSVTRNADAASMTGTNFSSWFNNGEGTVYAENSFIGVGSSSYPGVCKFSDGTISNRFGMYGRPSGAGYGAVMTALGSTTASLEPISGSTTTAINTYSRLSYGYKVNDFGATRNASTVTTDTSGNVAVGVNQLNIGLYDDYMNGTIKKLAYYPIKATSAQLQALTV